ncbi:MAG: Crp/Fnr family transcriptional regulator [Bacteroidota bacterium]
MKTAPPPALVTNLTRRTEVPEEELALITSYFRRETFSRGKQLIVAGGRCDKIFYIETGLLKSYLLTEGGKEKVVMFGFPDWWITDMDSFTNETPATVTIQASEKTMTRSLARADFDTLLNTSTAFESIFRKMMQYSYIREQRRAQELISLSASARHRCLIERYPLIEQTVAQKDIASYLGITPEFLSALKKDGRKS